MSSDDLVAARRRCVCGRVVLAKNWANHLLRQDGRIHVELPADEAVVSAILDLADRLAEAKWPIGRVSFAKPALPSSDDLVAALDALPRLWWCPAWGTLNAVRYHGNGEPDDENCGKVAYVRDADLRAAPAAKPESRRAGKCGCNCICHGEEGPEWPGPCAACCEPGMNCDCGRALAAKPRRRIFVPEGSRDSGEVDRITAKGQYPQEPAAKPEPGLERRAALFTDVAAALSDLTGAYHLERKHDGHWRECQRPRCQNARLALEGRGPFATKPDEGAEG